MTTATTRKQSWAVLVLAVSAILFSLVPQMTAAQAAKVRLTRKQAKALAATAKTPEDHMKLAAYFNREADRLEADAKDHEDLAQTYRLYPYTMVGGKTGGNPQTRTPEHCEAAAKSLREAAKSSRELAAEHERMAKDASK